MLKTVEKYLLHPDPDLDINRMLDTKVDLLEDYFDPVDDLKIDNIGGKYLPSRRTRYNIIELLIETLGLELISTTWLSD